MVDVGSTVLVGAGEGSAVGTDWARGAVGSGVLSSGAVSESPPQARAASITRASSPYTDM